MGKRHWLPRSHQPWQANQKVIFSFLSCNIDQFFVIKSKSKFFCQSLTDQTAITAEHSVYVITRLLIIKPSFMTSLLLERYRITGGYSLNCTCYLQLTVISLLFVNIITIDTRKKSSKIYKKTKYITKIFGYSATKTIRN